MGTTQSKCVRSHVHKLKKKGSQQPSLLHCIPMPGRHKMLKESPMNIPELQYVTAELQASTGMDCFSHPASAVSDSKVLRMKRYSGSNWETSLRFKLYEKVSSVGVHPFHCVILYDPPCRKWKLANWNPVAYFSHKWGQEVPQFGHHQCTIMSEVVQTSAAISSSVTVVKARLYLLWKWHWLRPLSTQFGEILLASQTGM